MRLALSIGVSVLLFGCGGADAGIFDEKGDGATAAESSTDEETSAAVDSGATVEDTSEGTPDDGPPPPMDSATPPPLDTGTVLPDTAPPDVPMTGACPEPGGKTYMGHCYFPTMMTRSWTGSRDTCNFLKAHLVTITSSGEQAFVNGISSGDRWIGMFRPEGSPVAESSYRWLTTEAIGYDNWDSSEPNFSGSCVRLRSDGLWADNSCGTNLTAICERE